MTDMKLLIQLIARLDRNQMAIQAGLEEVALWIRQRGDDAVADNIIGAIEVLNDNAEFLAQGVAHLTVASGMDGWREG